MHRNLCGAVVLVLPSIPELYDYGTSDKTAVPRILLTCTFSQAEITDWLSRPGYREFSDEFRAAVVRVVTQGLQLEVNHAWSAGQLTSGRIKFVDQDGLIAFLQGTFPGSNTPHDKPKLKVRDELRKEIALDLWKNVSIRDGWRRLEDKREGNVTVGEALHKWERPPQSERFRTRDHAKLVEHFLFLTGLTDIRVAPQSDGGPLNLTWHGRYLPITAYGDGIQHLLMMAFEFSRYTDHVFLIEEPETHLHPRLQRHLADIILNTTAPDRLKRSCDLGR